MNQDFCPATVPPACVSDAPEAFTGPVRSTPVCFQPTKLENQENDTLLLASRGHMFTLVEPFHGKSKEELRMTRNC